MAIDRTGLSWLEKAGNLPEAPGVYQFLDAKGEVIYVGKATSLRQRVKSYLGPWDTILPKERAIQEKAADLSFLVTGNVMEAMLTEATLIKQLQPRLNVRLKDDKRYPYLRISLSEPWPRLALVRWKKVGVDKYFGPFTDTGALRQTIRTLSEIFQVRSCKIEIGRKLLQPCLEHRIHRCLAPCSGNVDPAQYRQVVESVILYLEGKGDFLLRSIQERMERESKRMNYEGAGLLRDQFFALRKVLEHQAVLTRPTVQRDLVAFQSELGETCMAVLKIRAGKLAGAEHFFLAYSGVETPQEIAGGGLLQYYSEASDLPKETVVNVELNDDQDTAALRQFLEKVRKVKLQPLPKRGERREQLNIAIANASEYLALRLKEKEASFSNLDLLAQVQQELGLPTLPVRAECYDISNLGSEEMVAARVVFRHGTKHRPDYRHYKIRHSGQDDYESIREVLRRRLHSSDPLPDLILIDGGKGHLDSALQALQEKGAVIPLLSLAKENEWVYSPASPDPIVLPRNSPVLQLLQRMRDEAHRFAVSFHRKLRSKKIRQTSLDDIPGIGPAKKRLIQQSFGSYRVLQRASYAEIASIPGLGEKAALKIYNRVHHEGH
jgi:excinuclease ABC subunit C